MYAKLVDGVLKTFPMYRTGENGERVKTTAEEAKAEGYKEVFRSTDVERLSPGYRYVVRMEDIGNVILERISVVKK